MNKAVSIETLLIVGIGAISSGVAFIQGGELVTGAILAVIGLCSVILRGYCK